MKINSTLRLGGAVTFPAFEAERVYMVPFTQAQGLPLRLRRWQETVDAMLAGLKFGGPIYLMIDQSEVVAGQSHRRPGPHVEGNWDATSLTHPTHRHRPYKPEVVILASDVPGCRAFLGSFTGAIGDDGECEQLDLRKGCEVLFAPNRAYLAGPTTVHESITLNKHCERTVVRLNLPGLSL